MTGRFQTLRVASVRAETADAVVVGFAPEDRAAFAFQPGQYLTLRAEIDGAAEQRCYSICSAPGDDEIKVAIKHVPGGRFSAWARQALAVGVSLDVMPPEGRFGRLPEVPAGGGAYLAIAAGSGVTPILSLIRTLLATERESRFTFVYGNRAAASIMFREALDDLKDRYLDRFSLVHVLSRERHDAALAEGRIDGAMLVELAESGFIAPDQADAIFLCGPGDFLDAVSETLLGLGAAPEAIQTERFLPSPGGRSAKPSANQPGAAPTATVTAIVDGASLSFEMAPDDVSAVLAAERQGVDLPSSCRGGMCCTCRARVVDGEADMAVNYSLEDWELAAGFVLACQVRPKTPALTLDFDAV